MPSDRETRTADEGVPGGFGINPTITSVNGQDASSGSVNIWPPGPWSIQGSANGTNGTGTLMALTFQVVTDTNPVRSIPVPIPPPDPYSFTGSIPAIDIPGNGTYLLCVTAYYTDGSASVTSINLVAVGFPVAPPPPVTLPAGQGP